MAAYSLTASLRLQADSKSLNVIRDNVQKALSNTKVQIDTKSVGTLTAQLSRAAKQAASLSQSMADVSTSTRMMGRSSTNVGNYATQSQRLAVAQKNVADATKTAHKEMGIFGTSIDMSVKKMGAFLLGGNILRKFYFQLKESISNSIQFQLELSKLSVIVGSTVIQTQELGRSIRDLGIKYGVSSDQIAKSLGILGSAGFSMGQLKGVSESLAQVLASPSFGNLGEVSDAIILLNTVFKKDTPKEYTRSLEAIANVADQFPSEARGIVKSLSYMGGVFEQTNSTFEDTIAIFTAAKSALREADESTATNLRNIATRMQRFASVDLLRGLGVESLNVDGTFRPIFDVLKDLSEVVKSVPQGDARLQNTFEKLVGQKQVARLIPLLKNFEIAESAKNVALKDGITLQAKAEARAKTLAGQIASLNEVWNKFADDITTNEGVIAMTKHFRGLTSAILGVSSSLMSLLGLFNSPIFASILGAGVSFSAGRLFGGVMNTSMFGKKPQAADTTYKTDAKGRFIIDLEETSKKVGGFGQALQTAKSGVATFGTFIRANARMLTGLAGAFGLLYSYMRDTNQELPATRVNFDVMSTALIAATLGLGGLATAGVTAAVALVSYSKMMDEERKKRNDKLQKDITDTFNDRRNTVTAFGNGGDKFLQDEATKQTIVEARAFNRRDIGVLDAGVAERSLMIAGRFLRSGVFKQDLDKQAQEADTQQFLSDFEQKLPDFRKQLAEAAKKVSSFDELKRGNMRDVLLAVNKYERIKGIGGTAMKALERGFATGGALAPQYTTRFNVGGVLGSRADSISRNTAARNKNQELLSLPLTNFERRSTAEIEKAFQLLPQILSTTIFSSDKWDAQLSTVLEKAGIDKAIVSSVNDAVEGMSFDDFDKNLMDTAAFTDTLLSSYKNHRDGIEKLTSAVKEAANALKEKLTAAIDNIGNYQQERQKLATMVMDYNSFVRRPTNPADIEAIRQQDVRELAGGDFSIEQIGEAARAYQSALDSGTASLMQVPQLETSVTRLKTALGKLSDASATLAAIEKRRSEVEESKQGKLSAVEAIVRNPLEVARQAAGMRAAQAFGLENLPEKVRDAALQGMETFANVKMAGMGGLTGAQLKEQQLTRIGAKMGLDVTPENNELIRLNEAQKLVQEQALRAQLQLVLLNQAIAANTAKMAGVPFTPPALVLPPAGATPQAGPQGGLFNVRDKISLKDKSRPQSGVQTAAAAGAPVVDPQGFITAANIINSASKNLLNVAEAFKGLTVNHVGRFSCEVIHNGLAVWNTMNESFQKLVNETVKQAINTMLDKKFHLPPMDDTNLNIKK